MKHIINTALVALAFSSPAFAQGDRAPIGGPLLGGIVQEHDVTLVFDYLRDALKAGMQGREVQPPEELTHRAEVIGEELKARGATAARAAIDAIEDAVRENLRERDRLPPRDDQRRI